KPAFAGEPDMADGVLVADLVERQGLLADEAAVDAAGHVSAAVLMEHPADVGPSYDDAENGEHNSHQALEEDRVREEHGDQCRCQRSDRTEQGVEGHVVPLEQQQADAQDNPGDDHFLSPGAARPTRALFYPLTWGNARHMFVAHFEQAYLMRRTMRARLGRTSTSPTAVESRRNGRGGR